MGVRISAIEYHLPPSIISNADLEKQFKDWSADKIEEKTGIRERHVAADNETALDLASHVCEKVFYRKRLYTACAPADNKA